MKSIAPVPFRQRYQSRPSLIELQATRTKSAHTCARAVRQRAQPRLQLSQPETRLMDGEDLKLKADEIAKAGRPAFGTISDAFRDQEVHYGSVGEELRRAMEGTSTAAAALTHSLERIPDLSFLSHDPLTLDPSQVYVPDAMSLATA
jgi:hypothetical protein